MSTSDTSFWLTDGPSDLRRFNDAASTDLSSQQHWSDYFISVRVVVAVVVVVVVLVVLLCTCTDTFKRHSLI